MIPKHYIVAAALVLAAGAPATFAESLWVKSATADLHTGKGAVYPSAGTLTKGAEVTVVTRDSGWVQVTAAGKTGWLFEGSLSKDRVGGDVNLLPGATAEMGTGIAARGLQPGAEAYVSSRRIDKRPLEGLIALRKGIPPAEWVAFVQPVHK